MDERNRRYERIEIELPCRLYIPGKDGKDGLKFQAFCTSRNLGLGGIFVASSFLLKEDVELFVELSLPSGPLAIRSRVAHCVPLDHAELNTGMGVEFLDVDAHGRETLLRYFTPTRYQKFYAQFTDEFPHLEKELPIADVSLLLNLWEEWKIRNEGGPSATGSGAPPATHRRGGEAEPRRLAPGPRSTGRARR
ncbi:MAG TPA: PilZ domain-containing protein [Anaeromyxobacter sp.]